MIATVTLNVSVDKRYVVGKFEQGTVMRVEKCTYTPGGKGINVSKIAAIAGERVIATGFIGGYAGAYVTKQLVRFGIDSRFVEVPGETRSCVNLFDRTSGMQTELLEPGVVVPPENVREFIERFPETIRDCQVVTISGSVPQGVDMEIYRTLIEIAKGMNKKVILDAGGTLLRKGMEVLPTMVKPNREELCELLGADCRSQAEYIDAAKQLHGKGIPVVVVSIGKDGAFVVSNDGIFQGFTPEVRVENTVGCGDAMVAGFAIGFARGYSMEETFRQALAISTASAMCAETGRFLENDFVQVLPKVTVIRL